MISGPTKPVYRLIAIAMGVVQFGLSGCDGDEIVLCEKTVSVIVVSETEVEIDKIRLAITDLEAELDNLAKDCGAKLTVFHGLKDPELEESFSEVMRIVWDAESVGAVGVAVR